MGQEFRNCIVSAQRKHLKKTNVFRKANSVLFVFGFLAWSFWVLGNENIGMFIKTEFYPFTEICFAKKKSNNFLFVFFWILGKNFSKFYLITWRHLCWNCLVSVQMNLSLWKKVLDIFFSSVMMSQKSSTFGTKNSRFVKTAFYFSTGIFWGNIWHV